MIFSTIRKMAAGILPESSIVLYHGERLRRKTAKKTPEHPLRCFSSLLCNYSAGLIAPLGQVSLQVPQSRQELASIT